MAKYLLIILFAFTTLAGFSQNKSSFVKKKYRDTTAVEKLSVRMAYYGLITFHPGLKVGVEYPLKRKIKEISRYPLFSFLGIIDDKGTKIIHKDWIGSANFAFYNFKENHTGFMLTAEAGRRRTGRRGGFKEIAWGLGALKTFQTTTYNMDKEAGKTVFMPGHLFYTASIGIAYGHDYSIRKNKGICWYIKPSYYMIFPYNSFVTFEYAFEAGITYRFLKNPFKS